MKYKCSIYKEEPEHCRDYPWNEANDLFPSCIFYNAETDTIITEETVLETKTKEELQEYCISCGKCCFYWEDGKPVIPCSALEITEDVISEGVIRAEMKSQNLSDGSFIQWKYADTKMLVGYFDGLHSFRATFNPATLEWDAMRRITADFAKMSGHKILAEAMVACEVEAYHRQKRRCFIMS